MQETKDITIIGAGPTGLFAAFYAGMRGASHRLIDNLDQVGGQLTALYPEKYIFDVAGFPKILSKDLVKALAEQGLQWKPPVHLGEKVIGLQRVVENGKSLFTIVTDRDEYPGRTVLIAGGIGAFTPRKLPLKDVDRWNEKGLHDRVLNPRIFTGKRILIVGGGDSAFDWAVNLQGIAKSIVMIHRRDGFRAHQATVDQVQALTAAGKMELRTFWELKAIDGGERIERVTIFNNKTKEEQTLSMDCVIPQHQGGADDGDQHPRHLRRRGHHHVSGEAEAYRDRVLGSVYRREPDRALPESCGEGHAGALVEHGALWSKGRLTRQLHHH